MHEKLYEQIEAMDEKVAGIVNACLDNMQKALDRDREIKSSTIEASITKTIGEGLKALADGLESYRAVTRAIKSDATQEQSWLPPTESEVISPGYTGEY